MINRGPATAALSALTAVLLAGCAATVPEPVVVAPPRIAPPPLVAPPRPRLPAGVASTYAAPPRDSYGKYVTPNGGLSQEEALWHLRMGLNVAALSCQTVTDEVNVAYGNFLTLHKARLARANTAMDALWEERAGRAEGRTARDNHSVEVYNFFALPTITPEFCATATRVLATANGTPSDSLDSYATVGLAELEAPFTNFFARYDGYKVAVGNWDRLYGTAPGPIILGPTTPAAATPVFRAAEVTYDPVTNQPIQRPLTDEAVAPVDPAAASSGVTPSDPVSDPSGESVPLADPVTPQPGR